MSDIQPATDAEIDLWRAQRARGWLFNHEIADRLLARLDAATARIAEVEREKTIGVERVIDAKIRAETAERKLKAAREAAQGLVAAKFSTYRARNGREIGIEDDSGEKVWLVPSDQMHALEVALALIDKTGGEG